MENEKKFVATQLIENIYYLDKNMIKNFSKSFDFTEETKKINCDIKDRSKFNIEESLSGNLIANLPLEVYRDLVSLDGWFVGSHVNKNNPISTALVNKKFDFINLILDKLQEKLNHNKLIDEKFNNQDKIYSNLILEKILSFPIRERLSNYAYSKKDVDKDFFSIWQRTLVLINDFENYIYIGYRSVVEKSFTDKVNGLYNLSMRVDSLVLLRESCETKSMFIFFAKIMNEASPGFKEELKNLKSKTLIELSLFAGNKKVVDFLLKEKLYNNPTVFNVIKILNEKIVSHNVPPIGKDLKDYLWIFETCKGIIDKKEWKNIPSENLVGVLSLIKDDKILFEKMIEDFPQIKSDSLIDSESIGISKIKTLEVFKLYFKGKDNANFTNMNQINNYRVLLSMLDHFNDVNQSKEEINEFINEIISSNTGLLTKFKTSIVNELNNKSNFKEVLLMDLLHISLSNGGIKKSNHKI